MKPRTKLQRRIVAASGRLPEITPAQLHWGYAHLLPHEAFRTKRGKITCTECRHTWQGDQQIDRAVCPHCGVRLTVVTTRRRTSWNKAYLSVVTTREGLQVVRYFLLERRVRDGQPARYECCEVMQRWITPDGKIATVARMRNMSYYSYDVWRCATPLELRSECWFYNRISVERSYPRCRLIPELRRMGLRYDLYAENPVGIFRYTFSQRHAETLLKIGRYDLFRYFCRAGGRRIEDYWPSLRICLRNGYRIDDAASWCDYIDMLGRLGKDIHNAHYKSALQGWCSISLNDCMVEILNGFAFQSGKYVENGIRVIRITNVQDGKIMDDDPKFYPKSSIKEIEKFILKKNDLLMSLTGNVGRVGFLPNELLPAALNQRVGCIRMNEQFIHKKYLFYYFQTDTFRNDCITSAKGVAQLNISTEWLKRYLINIPPYAEQKRIVAKIEELFATIDKIKESLEA